MAASDRLSNLPNDLLRRILHFAPAKEGASTSLLARRWRSLWRSSGAVNLDSSSYNHLDRHDKRDVVMYDAEEALAAVHGRVTRFTFRYEEGEDDILRWDRYDSSSYNDDVVEGEREMARELERVLFRSPAAGQVEELRLGLFYGVCNDSPSCQYDLSIRDLPCLGSLRVLHISKCSSFSKCSRRGWWGYPLNPPPTLPFPRLVELRLHACSVSLSILHGLMDAAPHLATLHLDGVDLSGPTPKPDVPQSIHLRCSKISNLVLANLYCWGRQSQKTMEVEAPQLRCFTYEGPIRALSLKPSPRNMARVDLRFHIHADQIHTPDGSCRLFWKLIRSISRASIVNLNFQR